MKKILPIVAVIFIVVILLAIIVGILSLIPAESWVFGFIFLVMFGGPVFSWIGRILEKHQDRQDAREEREHEERERNRSLGYQSEPMSVKEIDTGIDIISSEYTEYEIDPVKSKAIHALSVSGDHDLSRFLNLLNNMRSTTGDLMAIESKTAKRDDSVDLGALTNSLVDLQRQWSRLKIRLNSESE